MNRGSKGILQKDSRKIIEVPAQNNRIYTKREVSLASINLSIFYAEI